MKKVLFAGESWISYSRHIKGFDSFFTAKYEEGIQWIKKSIEKAGYEFCYISNTYAAEKFPRTLEELKEYVRFGNAVASLCVEKKGAIPAMPTLEEVEKKRHCSF